MEQTDQKVLKKLQELGQEEAALSPLFSFYGELFQIQSEAKSWITIVKPVIHDELIHDRLIEGIPLLLFEEFAPDWRQVQKVFAQIIGWAGSDKLIPEVEKENLRKISGDLPRLKRLAKTWYQGQLLESTAKTESVDFQLLESVIADTLKPFLSAYRELLLPSVDQELWRRRYCPVCGGKPDFAYIDKEKGARWVLCSRCDAVWLFGRVECPYCGTREPNSLAYYTGDSESSLYRLYVCRECHSYIKAIDFRRTDSEILLSFERVKTFDLDKQAFDLGYKPGNLSYR